MYLKEYTNVLVTMSEKCMNVCDKLVNQQTMGYINKMFGWMEDGHMRLIKCCDDVFTTMDTKIVTLNE